MKKTFRFSLRTEEHADLIKMIENCPKSLRNELFILALKMLNQYKSNLILGQNQSFSAGGSMGTDRGAKFEKQSGMSEINVSDIFKF